MQAVSEKKRLFLFPKKSIQKKQQGLLILKYWAMVVVMMYILSF